MPISLKYILTSKRIEAVFALGLNRSVYNKTQGRKQYPENIESQLSVIFSNKKT